MEYILSLSYGKDSLACLGAIEELGWTLNRIVHAEVWATDTIPADPPPMVEFKAKADAIIKARWGIEVEHIRSKQTAESIFYHKRLRGNRIGQIAGWPMIQGCELQKPLKVTPLHRIGSGVTYIGIAADEPNRFHVLTDVKKSPLVEAGWSEQKCLEWCEINDLLSPIYTMATRSGCWFCPCQGTDQLRILRKKYPEYWVLMLKWDEDSPVPFKANGHTVHDYDRRFQAEDLKLISPDDKVFRWKTLDEELNFRLF